MSDAHQVVQHVGIFAAGGQILPDGLAQMVVGRDQADALYVRAALHRDLAECRKAVDHHLRRLLCRAELRIALQNLHDLHAQLVTTHTPYAGIIIN